MTLTELIYAVIIEHRLLFYCVADRVTNVAAAVHHSSLVITLCLPLMSLLTASLPSTRTTRRVCSAASAI